MRVEGRTSYRVRAYELEQGCGLWVEELMDAARPPWASRVSSEVNKEVKDEEEEG